MARPLRQAANQRHSVIWEPQPRQEAFITCPADDVGFGGARGGGKSDGVVGDWIDHENAYGADAIGMAFRRERTQLIELIERAKQILVPIGYRWHDQDKYFRGPKGGRLRFAYLESDSDADGYQGHSYTRLYPEEMGTFPSEGPINKLQATLRSGNGVPCQMKGTCNPGGPGHQWVKKRYRLDTAPQGFQLFETEFVNPFTKKKITKTRMFIPSRVTDNKYLGDDYVANLFQVGTTQLVRAWLEGDWSVIDGAFFDCWSTARHVIPPFAIPDDWLRFRSGDWGSAKPFSIGWWAVVSDDYELSTHALGAPPGQSSIKNASVADRNRSGAEGMVGILPRGSLIRYRELYGAAAPNVGLKLPAEDVADRIRALETEDETVAYSVMDPAAFSSDGGPSIAERMASRKVYFQRADNARVSRKGAMGGWDQLRARLIGDGERPMIYFFSTCLDLIRTLPALQHDQSRPEDVDTDSEDHAPDECRYACMSRPYIKHIAAEEKTKRLVIGEGNEVSLDDLWDQKPKYGREKRI